jgi:hypothetical protein
MLLVLSELLDDNTHSAPRSMEGRVRTVADWNSLKPGDRTDEHSFGDFSLHEQRKVTRLPARRAEALLWFQWNRVRLQLRERISNKRQRIRQHRRACSAFTRKRKHD